MRELCDWVICDSLAAKEAGCLSDKQWRRAECRKDCVHIVGLSLDSRLVCPEQDNALVCHKCQIGDEWPHSLSTVHYLAYSFSTVVCR